MRCSQLFLATKTSLRKTISSDIFSVRDAGSFLDHREYRSLKTFPKSAHLYYLAPHDGCGCGWDAFDYSDNPEYESDINKKNKASAEALRQFLHALQDDGIQFHIFNFCIDRDPGNLATAETDVDTFIDNLADERIPYGTKGRKIFTFHRHT